MLKVIQRFGKHCSCHLQGEYVGLAFFENLISGRQYRLMLQKKAVKM
jgi:hypothetical protein